MEYQAYPKYLYGPADTFRIVANAEEQTQAEADGFWAWRPEPPAPPPDTASEAVDPPRRRGRPRRETV